MTRSIESPKRPKIVGNFIRQRRETLKLSQRALGQLFDPPVTTQFISNVERGVTPLPPVHVPTLTKALQVSETEMMALLEKEYTLKLSGRLGLAQETPGKSRAGSVVLSTPEDPVASALIVAPHDFELMHGIYEAFKAADPKARQAFLAACQSVLNLRLPATSTTALGALSLARDAVSVGSGERPEG